MTNYSRSGSVWLGKVERERRVRAAGDGTLNLGRPNNNRPEDLGCTIGERASSQSI